MGRVCSCEVLRGGTGRTLAPLDSTSVPEVGRPYEGGFLTRVNESDQLKETDNFSATSCWFSASSESMRVVVDVGGEGPSVISVEEHPPPTNTKLGAHLLRPCGSFFTR